VSRLSWVAAGAKSMSKVARYESAGKANQSGTWYKKCALRACMEGIVVKNDRFY